MRWVLLLVLAAASATGATAWPAVTYKGKPRDARWLDATYAYFKARMAVVEGQAVATQRVYEGGVRLKVGDCSQVVGKIVQVQPQAKAVLITYQFGVAGWNGPTADDAWLQVKGIETAGLVDGAPWHGTVAAVGTYRYVDGLGRQHSVLACVPLPEKRPPITREQFAAALSGGFELVRWTRRLRPKSEPGIGRYVYARHAVD